MQDSQIMLKLSVIWRGNTYVVETNSNAYLKELGHELQNLTNVKAATMRLIVPQSKGSKLLYPFSDDHSSFSLQEVSIIEGKPIRMMGVFEDEVDKVLQNDKADLRIIGFDEEEKRLRQRMLDRPHTSLKLPQGQYIFCNFHTLQIPGVELNPPASEALKRMHRLAADHGIVAIMNKHRWRVGIMTELAPVGYVGVSPKCVLGFNKNHGEEISLRLRTDDLKGFRKYESIKKTLLHELAHMVYSEHDANFYALDKQLNQEAASLDWTRSAGHTLTGFSYSDHYEDDFYAGDTRNLSQKLGGNDSDQLESARASSVAAAYRRLANVSANSVGVPEVHEEPNPDDSGFVMREEFDHMDSVEKENPELMNQSRSDPSDHCGNQNKIEPDPRDLTLEPLKIGKKLAATNSYEGHKVDNSFSKFSVVAEPDSYHSLVMEVDNMLHPRKIVAEPDPDDSKAKQEILGYTNILRPDYSRSLVKETLEYKGQCMAHKEPDPDESQANRIVQEEPDPDESQANQIVQEEPDPDDSQENGIVHEEPDPDDNLVHPQGISSMEIDEPDPDDQELRRIQDSVTAVCSSLKKAIEMLQAEVNPLEKITVLQTLFKIIRNVIEHPDEMKYKRLRKANPVIQRNIANYKAALEILYLIGFIEDVVLDEIGKAETYLVLKRNDPGLLWLAKSSLETCITY